MTRSLSFYDIVDRTVPRVSKTAVFDSFDYDDEVFRTYFENVYLDVVDIAMRGADIHDWPTVSDALQFPRRVGMDPRLQETAGWARFACEQPVMNEEKASLGIETRFEDRDDVFLLLDAGVPLAYAVGVSARWGHYPTKRVIEAFAAGIPLDYVNLLGLGSEAEE